MMPSTTGDVSRFYNEGGRHDRCDQQGRQNEAKSAAAGASEAWAGIGARSWDLFGLIQDLYAATRAPHVSSRSADILKPYKETLDSWLWLSE